MVADRMRITTMARDTIAAIIATTTVGKEEPGAIRAFSLPGVTCHELGSVSLKFNDYGFFERGRSRNPHPFQGFSRYLALQRSQETLEQCEEPFAGHSDGIDNGQGDKSGDEAVFDCGGGGLVAQKLSKHSFAL
jgi:hypothetical protein